VLVILKQRIDTIKVEADMNIHSQVIGMETDAVCVPQECEPEVSHFLKWFLWWWLLIYILYVVLQTLRLVDLQSCLSGALHLLQC